MKAPGFLRWSWRRGSGRIWFEWRLTQLASAEGAEGAERFAGRVVVDGAGRIHRRDGETQRE